MYKIGEFSKITQLSVKTLRYYDEEHMLSPSMRDEENHYRYYDEHDFKRAQLLILLRSLDFSIMEIKDILSTLDQEGDLSFYIKEKQEQIKVDLQKKQELIARMDTLLAEPQNALQRQAYEIQEVELPPTLVACYKYEGKYEDVGLYVGRMYKEIKGNLTKEPNFNLYYDEEYKEQAHIELCIPIKQSYSAKFCKIKTLPGIKGISLIHHGPYEALCYAYKTILDEAKQRGYELLVPSRECYLKGPGRIFKGNPESYITQIIIPYKEDNQHE